MPRAAKLTKIRRPISGCMVAMAALPGLAIAAGLILAGAFGSAPVALRIGLAAMGVFFLVIVLAFATGSAGVLVDSEQRTVQLYFAAVGMKRLRDSIQVQPDDQLVVDTVVLATARNAPVTSARLCLVGPERRELLMATRSREQASKVAQRLSELLKVPVAPE